jgi:NADH-quinone oxidoreductase subunit H
MTELDAILQHPLFTPVVLMAVIVLIFPLLAGYVVLVERKVLADMQVRLGPMRVGPHGLLQPIADAVKLLLKEDIIPAEANRWIFFFAPILATFTGLGAFAVVPFSSTLYIADVNIGLLVISALSAVGILGIILGGWASNSHYALLGSLRSAAQLVSYEVAMALGLVCGVMAAGSLSMVSIVQAQEQRGIWFVFDNFGLMVPAFMVFFIAAVAETNRAPFDLPEAESELVAGFHTEYSGFRWALYMLAEYANIFVVSAAGVTLFLGGWLRPFPNVGWLELPLNHGVPLFLFGLSALSCLYLARRQKSRIHRVILLALAGPLFVVTAIVQIPAVNAVFAAPFWLLLKIGVFIYVLIWFRGTFPRFRYDQLMDIGWKRLIPLGLGAIIVNAAVGILRQ